MTLAYGAALIVSLAGMLALDLRHRLLLAGGLVRGAVVLAAGVAFFVAWDLAGIGSGVFFRGQTPYMTGILVARELPVEELLFLAFLCYLTMNLYVASARWLVARRERGQR